MFYKRYFCFSQYVREVKLILLLSKVTARAQEIPLRWRSRYRMDTGKFLLSIQDERDLPDLHSDALQVRPQTVTDIQVSFCLS